MFVFIPKVKTLLYGYTYMDVGGRATQEQVPSSLVCPPGYVKKLTKGAAISSLFHYASQANTTARTQEVERIMETESETTLHTVQPRILRLSVLLPIHFFAAILPGQYTSKDK